MKTNDRMDWKILWGQILAMSTMALVATAFRLYANDTDHQIESAAKETYTFKTYLTGDDIDVESKNGQVTLKGTVLNQSHKSLAEETVKDLPGVKKVDNHLQVNEKTYPGNSDVWIATKIKATLMFHRYVDAANTDVEVKKGLVTLRGKATSSAKR